MADAKLTALTANTAPTGDDLLYLVDAPGGSPLSRKVTVDNFLLAMFTIAANASAMTDDDEFFIRNDPAGTPAIQRLTLAELAGSIVPTTAISATGQTLATRPTNYAFTLGSSYTTTLPALADVTEGTTYLLHIVSVTGASVLTLDGASAETITYYGTAAATQNICALGGLYRLTKINSAWQLHCLSLSTSQQVVCVTGNGQGSTDTKVRRYTNTTQTGQSIVVSTVAANGTIFTIAESGHYVLTRTDVAASAQHFGVSVNSSQLTTNIASITTANRLTLDTTGAGIDTCSGWGGNLTAGDIVRAHDGGTVTNGTTVRNMFSIARVG